MINLTIDNQKVQTHEGQMILHAAQAAGISIPNLCHSNDFPAQGSCGICVVEVTGAGHLIRACATPVAQGMEIHTQSRRVIAARKRLLELQLSDHTGDCKAPCQLACPAQTDCQGYIALIAQGQPEEAFLRMMEAHPFPASVARVCPRPCEAKCKRGLHDEPVNIAGLKRFAADGHGMYNETIRNQSSLSPKMCRSVGIFGSVGDGLSSISQYIPEIRPDTGHSVAIVGGGPAGLTAAYFLRRAGHDVTVFDYMPQMGGLLRYGIPEYRLPKAVLDEEIERLARMGIRFHNGVKIVSEAMMKEKTNGHNPVSPRQYMSLSGLQEKNNAVIIAIGAGISRPLGIPGEDLPSVIGGIDFLQKVACIKPENLGADCRNAEYEALAVHGKKITVIGGSNTAIDSARTALRLGAGPVTVAYRRTKSEMPAEPEEIAEAEAEGVKFKFLAAPMEITKEGIRLQMMTMGEPDADGRLSPVPIPGKEEWLESDRIITAIGQSVAPWAPETLGKSRWGIGVDPESFQTSRPGVFAIGDATGQSAYAIEAIGHGRKAAAAVHKYLTGNAKAVNSPDSQGLPWETLPGILVKDENPPIDLAPETIPSEILPKKEAPKGFEEIHQNFTAAQAAKEASRCLSCGCKGYDSCKLIALTNQYSADPKQYYPAQAQPKRPLNTNNPSHTYDPNKCIQCGLCIHACAKDRAILTMAHRGLKTQVAAHPESNCAKCGNCAAVCPVGARVQI